MFSCANKLEAWTWTRAIRDAVKLATRNNDKDNENLGGYRTLLHDASEIGLTCGPSIWRHVRVSRNRVMGLDDPQNVSSIRFAAMLQGVSVDKFVSSRLTFHIRFKCDNVTYSDLPYSTLTDLSGKGNNEFDFHFFDHHKRTDKDEIEDRTLSLELWVCSKSNTRRDPPLAFCLCDCDVTLSDVWNRGTKRFRCPMYVRPKWTLNRVRDILSDVNDNETLDGAWISVGDALRSVDLPLSLPLSSSSSKSKSKEKERRRSSGMSLLRKALYQDDPRLEDDEITLLSHGREWHGEIQINDKVVDTSKCKSSYVVFERCVRECHYYVTQITRISLVSLTHTARKSLKKSSFLECK